jgi:two-component system chemotaxis response regulator CheY
MNIKKMLTSLGHEVIAEAESGFEAIEMYRKHSNNIDLTTMDITMPMHQGIEDGIAAVKEIISFDPSAKIVMVTSHGEQQKVIGAIQSGAANYMLKPIKIEKLTETLNKVLG